MSSTQVASDRCRILLKISGEALGDASKGPLDAAVLGQLARELVGLRAELDVEVALVVGGGNIWRGTYGIDMGIDAPTSDNIGMLATVMNALALQSAIEGLGQPVRLQSAINMAELAEPYIRRRAIRHLEKGRIVIFAAGTGNPFFTTDTAAALRAAEIGAQTMMKGTHSGVNGIYSADPRLDPSATKYDHVGYMDVIARDLNVMDMTAVTFCKDHDIRVISSDLTSPGNIAKAWRGEIGTVVD
ncbi:MAG: UMP kinase [Actinobacteria bacterium]|nr:UMP kinase [Actinomycetota bacterium]